MIDKIVIENLVFQKIMHWVNKSNYEVSGMGLITRHDNILVVTEAMLLPQTNGRAHTDIEPEDVGKLEFQLKDMPGQMKFWWHSHVDMSVFWSHQDRETQKDLAAGGWFLSTVFNKKREMRSAICMQKPIPLFIDDIKTEVIQYLDKELTDEWDASYDLNVTVKTHDQAWRGARGYWDEKTQRFIEYDRSGKKKEEGAEETNTASHNSTAGQDLDGYSIQEVTDLNQETYESFRAYFTRSLSPEIKAKLQEGIENHFFDIDDVLETMQTNKCTKGEAIEILSQWASVKTV